MADNTTTLNKIDIAPKGTQGFIDDLNANFTTLFNYFSGGGVGEDAIQNGAVTNEKLSDDAVSTEKIQDRAITEDKLKNTPGSEAVTNATIRDGTIKANKINNDSEFKALIRSIVYPVGSYYWNSNPINPGDIFGGTWEQIKDKFILAAGDTYQSDGGSPSVTLKIENLPSHYHNVDGNTASGGGHYHGLNGWTHQSVQAPNDRYGHYHNAGGVTTLDRQGGDASCTKNAGGHYHTLNINTNSIGGNSSFSIMPPYIVAYCWRRIG